MSTVPETLSVPLVCVAALLMDRLLGEPRRWHPLVGFGRLAQAVETRCNRAVFAAHRRWCGMAAWVLLVLPPVLLVWVCSAWLAQRQGVAAAVLDTLLLYWAVGWQSMREHVLAVQRALMAGDLPLARLAVGRIVSRDTQYASAQELLNASLETTLENSADALFASLFWYMLAGAPGVVLHRLANTLDAMWGYRSPRFVHFGWWAARTDDVLAFLPSQLLTLSFSLLRPMRPVLRCWKQQGWQWKSINAGSVMSGGAAAMGVKLGGAACYDGQPQLRATLGCGRVAGLADIERAFRLVHQGLCLWLVTLVLVYGVLR